MRKQGIEGLILVQPLGCSFRPDAGDAGNIVRGVADQREIIDDLFRIDIELCFHADAIQARVAHGVQQFDAGPHQLRHVLVAGGNQYFETGIRALLRQCADHIVRFDSRHAQQRHAHRADHIVQRLHLRAHVIRHRCAMRLVLIEEIVPERSAGRVEHHRDPLGRFLFDHFVQHIEHAQHRAGRFAARVGEGRQRVERAIQIARAVDQNKFARRHVRAPSIFKDASNPRGAACRAGWVPAAYSARRAEVREREAQGWSPNPRPRVPGRPRRCHWRAWPENRAMPGRCACAFARQAASEALFGRNPRLPPRGRQATKIARTS